MGQFILPGKDKILPLHSRSGLFYYAPKFSAKGEENLSVSRNQPCNTRQDHPHRHPPHS